MPIAYSPTNRNAVLAIILVSYVMIVLDISIVITGLPKIHAALGFSDEGLSWVQSAYTLTFGGFLLLAARAGDIFGRRRMFMAGLALFTLASLAIAAAPSAGFMLAARAVQGLGSAILAPSTLALIQSNFPAGPERTRAVAYYGAAAGISACVGLVLGGLLADWVSWRAGFFINLPIGIALIAVTPRFIGETARIPTGELDIAGALTSTLGMTALVYGLVRSASHGWSDAETLQALVTGLVLVAAFIRVERGATQPIMPLRLFADRERASAYAARVLFLGAMVGFWYFTSLFLQGVSGYSPALTGLAFLPITLFNFGAALLVPRLTRRFGNGRLLIGGLIVSLVGIAWLSLLSAQSSYLFGIALPMVLIGIGQGATLSPLTAAGIANVAPQDAGVASGIVNAAHQLGSSLGLSVLVAASLGAGSLAGPELLAHRVSVAFVTGALMLCLALVLIVAFRSTAHKPAAAAAPLQA